MFRSTPPSVFCVVGCCVQRSGAGLAAVGLAAGVPLSPLPGAMLMPGNGLVSPGLFSPSSRLSCRPLPLPLSSSSPSSSSLGGSGMSTVLKGGAGWPLRAFVMASRQIGPGTSPPYTLARYTPPMVICSISTLWDGLPTQTAPDMFGV